MLPADLISILVCPKTKQPLIYFPRGESDQDEDQAFLFCPASSLRYRIDAGVPVMLVDEAQVVPPETGAHLVARATQLGLPLPT